MASEARFCRECGVVTQHVVVSGKDVMAQFCQECLVRWSTELDNTGKPMSGKLAPRQEGESKMQTKSAEAKPKRRIVAYEICCEVCNLSQHYHGKDHTRCIHCRTPLDLSKLKPKYE